MHNDPFYLLDPVFRFFDRLIAEEGDLLYLLLVYASIPLIVWILRGGLRRRNAQHYSSRTISVIVIRPPAQPPPLPPVIGEHPERGQWPPDDEDGEDSFAA